MYIIKKICCWLGFHDWMHPQRRIINEGYYDQEMWTELKCKDCGKVIEHE